MSPDPDPEAPLNALIVAGGLAWFVANMVAFIAVTIGPPRSVPWWWEPVVNKDMLEYRFRRFWSVFGAIASALGTFLIAAEAFEMWRHGAFVAGLAYALGVAGALYTVASMIRAYR